MIELLPAIAASSLLGSLHCVAMCGPLVGLGGTRTVRSGQLDDVDTPPHRILFEDDGTAQSVRGDPPSPQAVRGNPSAPAENRWHAT